MVKAIKQKQIQLQIAQMQITWEAATTNKIIVALVCIQSR